MTNAIEPAIRKLTVDETMRHLFTISSSCGNEVRAIIQHHDRFLVESIVEGEHEPAYARSFDSLEEAMRHASDCILECFRE